jgi:hypothetical protein
MYRDWEVEDPPGRISTPYAGSATTSTDASMNCSKI